MISKKHRKQLESYQKNLIRRAGRKVKEARESEEERGELPKMLAPKPAVGAAKE